MKRLLTTLSLAASLAACSALHAQPALDPSPLSGQPRVALGTVQSVIAVPIEQDIHAFSEPLELRLRPALTERLVIRLDEGSAVIVTVEGAQRFEAGQRVRVVSHIYSPYGPRVEHQ